jgi:hypothetical protein
MSYSLTAPSLSVENLLSDATDSRHDVAFVTERVIQGALEARCGLDACLADQGPLRRGTPGQVASSSRDRVAVGAVGPACERAKAAKIIITAQDSSVIAAAARRRVVSALLMP